MLSKIKSKNYIFSLIIMAIIMLLFYRSFYWTDTAREAGKIIEAAVIVFGIVVVPLSVVSIKYVDAFVSRFLEGCVKHFLWIRNNILKVAAFIGIYIIILLFSGVVELCLDRFIYNTGLNIMRYYIIAAFNTVLYIIFLFYNKADKKPEKLFFVITLVMGLTYINVMPPIVGLSWDDQIHYQRTLDIANYINGISYASDNKMIEECEKNSIERVGYDKQSRDNYVDGLTKMYESRETAPYVISNVGVGMVAYIPAAAGVVLARGAGLSYANIFRAGKVCNLLLYAILMYMAIKKLKYGKTFAMVFGMLPLLVFLASSYSYDPWLISFAVLGITYLLSSMYENDEKKCTRDMLLGIILITVGCLVKQVYFPLTFISVFVALHNYKNKKKCLKIFGVAALVSIFLLASFIIPMIISPDSTTDFRGGEGVNAIEQISYVLHNPLAYAKTLLNFLKSYLSIESMSYLTCYAYVGNGEYWGVTAVMLFVIAFLDRNSEVHSYKLVRVAGIIISAVCMVIVPSALYAAFTPVGADTIAGCSPRYIVPVLFSTLYFIAPDGVDIRFNRKLLTIIPIIILSVIIFNSLNVLCASLYI